MRNADENGLAIPTEQRGWSSFSSTEVMQWHTYNYAFRRVYMNNTDPTYPADPDGKFFKADLVAEAEFMYREPVCRKHKFGSCRARWELTGFICCAPCRERIPGYYLKDTPSLTPLDHDLSWRERIARAYRWTHSTGQTMPRGLKLDDPRVIELVTRYELEGPPQRWREQDDAREAAKYDPERYVAICMQQIRANLNQFIENSTVQKGAENE